MHMSLIACFRPRATPIWSCLFDQSFERTHITPGLSCCFVGISAYNISDNPASFKMSNHHETTRDSGLFNNHGAGYTHEATANNNAHLGATSVREPNDAHLAPSTARDGETLSAGSTANGSYTRMAEHNALEKDFSRQDGKNDAHSTMNNRLTYPGYRQHLDHTTDSDTALRQIQTAGSISISPELFEKLYLSPPNKVKGELRKTFGNPTPLYVLILNISPGNS
jgi:hypothetical protein